MLVLRQTLIEQHLVVGLLYNRMTSYEVLIAKYLEERCRKSIERNVKRVHRRRRH